MWNRGFQHGHRNLAFVFSFILLVGTGCVSTGDIKIQQPLESSIADDTSIRVQIKGGTDDLNAFALVLMKVLNAQLKETDHFKPVSGGGKLLLKGTLVSHNEGNPLLRAANLGGEAKCKVELELEETGEAGKVLTKFTVTGNSARTSTTTIGGFNTSWLDNLSNRALVAAGEQVIKHLMPKEDN
jgi:hypothetical protein